MSRICLRLGCRVIGGLLMLAGFAGAMNVPGAQARGRRTVAPGKVRQITQPARPRLVHHLVNVRHQRRVVQFLEHRHRSPRRYSVVNNRNWNLRNRTWEASGPLRRETVRSLRGPRVAFKTLRFFPPHVGGTHFIQSINITPDGRDVYLGCDAYPYLSGYTRIARVNLKKRRIAVGPRFFGGHGQALAYDPQNRSLWLLVDPEGPLRRGTLAEISTRSLRPVRRLRFNLPRGEYFGDSLAFDRHGTAYNEDRIWAFDAHPPFRAGSVVLYRGLVNHHQVQFHLIRQGIRHAPGYIIQGLAVNPKTRRLYIETDDAIMSVPLARLGRLRPRDVQDTILNRHREFEGLSFDQRGYAYIMMARPNELLKSTRVF